MGTLVGHFELLEELGAGGMGVVRVLLVPRIVSAGSAYRIEASLIEPRSGRVVDRLHVTASTREDVLLSGIDEFTRLVRQRLGESLPSIEASDPSLVEYATQSWEALRFLRIGAQALADSDSPRAARAFEQALEHDPRYPAALGSLGLLYIEFPQSARRRAQAARGGRGALQPGGRARAFHAPGASQAVRGRGSRRARSQTSAS